MAYSFTGIFHRITRCTAIKSKGEDLIVRQKIVHDLYIPIRNFGYFFVIIAFLGFFILIFKLSDVKYLLIVWVFVGSVSFFHLLLGTGIVLRKKWSFPIFKAYLHLLYLGFPVGTYLARATLNYIDKYKIEQYLR